MREIKFEFLYKGGEYGNGNTDRPWFRKVYSLDDLIKKPLNNLSDVHSFSELVAKRQYTGLKDRNGVEIYEGDIVESDFYYPDYMCIAEVSYCNAEARYKFNRGEGEQDAFVYGNLYVKGNIHQNPELLEKQQ